jgi:hypothetical protein
MKRTVPIHYLTSEGHIFCNSKMGVDKLKKTTLNWKEVTCKNCQCLIRMNQAKTQRRGQF